MTVEFTAERRKHLSEALKGRVFSSEHRANISKANKGKKRTEEQIKKMQDKSKLKKKVKCVETGVVYESQREAGRITGINSNLISQNCNGRTLTAGGFHWEFVIE